MKIINILCIVAISLGLLLGGCANRSSHKVSAKKARLDAASTYSTQKNSAKKNKTQKQINVNESNVYMMRGIINIFSFGLDDMAKKFSAKDINTYIDLHSAWPLFANKIIANKKAGNRGKVILIGHSLGANSVIKIAKKLQAHKIKVDLLITFDPTIHTEVPSNVITAVNYYIKSAALGKKLDKANGSKGSLENFEFSNDREIGHFNMEENAGLQSKVIKMVTQTVGHNK